MQIPNKKIIWQITDGKRGHENQSAGLIRALSKLHDVECIQLDIDTYQASWLRAIFGKLHGAEQLPKPDLIVGCGSRTHSTILSAGRTSGAPTIVIMAPPRGLSGLFNLCITPKHDKRRGKNIIETKGAMNLIQAGEANKSGGGLILIGGPSQHHGWDTEQLLEQIDAVLSASPEIEWIATTSRRTPEDTIDGLAHRNNTQLKLTLFKETDEHWLPAQLSQADFVWVSEDSVSMIYEALSSGAKVGVLPVPRKEQSSRVIRGVDRLIAEEQILPFAHDHCKLSSFSAPASLNEAGRVAKIVATRLAWS